jgi:hypothetical protein
MEEKSEHFILNFLKKYGKDEGSLIGRIYNKMKKRDEKAKLKNIQYYEEPTSEFDY